MAVDLKIVSIAVGHQAVFFNDGEHLCGIQKKKEGSKDRALRHSIVDSRSFRLFTVKTDKLTPICEV